MIITLLGGSGVMDMKNNKNEKTSHDKELLLNIKIILYLLWYNLPRV